MKFLQSAGPLILITLACISFGIYIKSELKTLRKINQENRMLENEVLRMKADSLIEENRQLDKKLRAYQSRIDSLSVASSRKDKQLKDLKQSQNEKLRSVDTLTSHELYQLFAGFNP
jgi:uncharacterized protein YlxW (UPF0749 family)